MARRGQAAMEFLMTYGWAILAVLVMVGALAYFGVISPSRLIPDKCLFGPGVRCSDYRAVPGTAPATQATVTAILSNSMGQPVTVNSVTAGSTGATACTGLAGAWQPEQTVTVTCTNVAVSSGVAGAEIKVPLTITYTNIGGTYTKTVTGEVTTKVV